MDNIAQSSRGGVGLTGAGTSPRPPTAGHGRASSEHRVAVMATFRVTSTAAHDSTPGADGKPAGFPAT